MKLDKKVIVTFTQELVDQADILAKELKISRSNLIRTAVAEKIELQKRRNLDAQLRFGYTEMAEQRVKQHKEICELTE